MDRPYRSHSQNQQSLPNVSRSLTCPYPSTFACALWPLLRNPQPVGKAVDYYLVMAARTAASFASNSFLSVSVRCGERGSWVVNHRASSPKRIPTTLRCTGHVCSENFSIRSSTSSSIGRSLSAPKGVCASSFNGIFAFDVATPRQLSHAPTGNKALCTKHARRFHRA